MPVVVDLIAGAADKSGEIASNLENFYDYATLDETATARTMLQANIGEKETRGSTDGV